MLVFLKLGGSLITDKHTESSAQLEVLRRLAQEVAAARRSDPGLSILLGHGSGSFGHFAAQQYGTRNGVRTAKDWTGFVKVWQEARRLNQIVVECMLDAGVPVVAFPPSAGAVTYRGEVRSWDLSAMRMALEADLVPLVAGDVVFDSSAGGGILSTEEQFFYLAPHFKPERILLAGIEEGVWKDFPQRQHLIPVITSATMENELDGVGASHAVDVTGGMTAKVRSMLDLLAELPGTRAMIFSGVQPGAVRRALLGECLGTLVCNSQEQSL